MDKLLTKKIFCRRQLESGMYCNTVVATTNGNQLFFDGEAVKNNPHFIGFDCPRCHQLIKWRQAKTSSVAGPVEKSNQFNSI